MSWKKNFLSLAVAALACGSFVTSGLSADDASGKAMAKTPTSWLVGKWKVIGCQLNETWLPQVIFKHFLYDFPDTEHFKLMWGDLSFPPYNGSFPKSDKGSLVIDTTVIPNTIDLIPESGPYKGKAFKGIFELDHDILKANFAFPGFDRPKGFFAEQHQVYEVWQKV